LKVLKIKDKEVLLDDDWYEFLSYANKYIYLHDNGYVAYTYKLKINGVYKSKKEYIHRIIVDPKPGYIVDHINLSKLDLRRSNLRECTRQQNTMNKGKQVGKYSSKYKGVEKTINNKFRVTIFSNKTKINLGYFFDEKEAAQVYNEAAIKYHREFASLNIID